MANALFGSFFDNTDLGFMGDATVTSQPAIDTTGIPGTNVLSPGWTGPAISPQDTQISPISAGSSDWMKLLEQGITQIAGPILRGQFAGPQPGQYYSYNPKTGQSTSYALPTGSIQAGLTSFPTSSSGVSTMLLLGGAALVLVMMMSRR